MQLARQLIKDGKLDEAFKLGEELKGMNAKRCGPPTVRTHRSL